MMGRVGYGAWLGAVLVGIVVLAPPVCAQSKSPELSNGGLSQAQKNELKSVFGGALVDGRSLALDPNATVAERRLTLARRAALYEELKEFAKAEESWTSESAWSRRLPRFMATGATFTSASAALPRRSMISTRACSLTRPIRAIASAPAASRPC
jgi:hypothetical protein